LLIFAVLHGSRRHWATGILFFEDMAILVTWHNF